MPALKTYDLFLSHMWRSAQNSDYYRLVGLLNNASDFYWRNYSVPEHNPLGTQSTAQLRRALDRQISPVNCFLVIAGMYVNYREWIQKELDIAARYGKRVVAISPMGQQRTPAAVRIVRITANEIVGWRTASIVDAIRRWSL